MTIDSTFEFEKRRNRPIRYNRETMATTIRAMKRVSEIQHKRQDLFWRNRMRAHVGTKREQIRAEIKKGIELIVPAAAKDREKSIQLSTSKLASKQKVSKSKKMEVSE